MAAPKVEKEGLSNARPGPSDSANDEHLHVNLERTHDAALGFLKDRKSGVDATLYHDAAYSARLRRKVDLLLMPFLFLIYVTLMLDKSLFGVRFHSPPSASEAKHC
jgi:hypothetical protein